MKVLNNLFLLLLISEVCLSADITTITNWPNNIEVIIQKKSNLDPKLAKLYGLNVSAPKTILLQYTNFVIIRKTSKPEALETNWFNSNDQIIVQTPNFYWSYSNDSGLYVDDRSQSENVVAKELTSNLWDVRKYANLGIPAFNFNELKIIDKHFDQVNNAAGIRWWGLINPITNEQVVINFTNVYQGRTNIWRATSIFKDSPQSEVLLPQTVEYGKIDNGEYIQKQEFTKYIYNFTNLAQLTDLVDYNKYTFTNQIRRYNTNGFDNAFIENQTLTIQTKSGNDRNHRPQYVFFTFTILIIMTVFVIIRKVKK